MHLRTGIHCPLTNAVVLLAWMIPCACGQTPPAGNKAKTPAARGDAAYNDSGPSETVNVKSFGAVGDGIANDTQAIQAAIDAIRKSRRARPQLFVPAGKYLVSRTLDLTNHGSGMQGYGLSVYGDGAGFNPSVSYGTVFIGSTGSAPVFDCSGSHFVTFRDFAVIAGGPNPSTMGILSTRTMGSSGLNGNLNLHLWNIGMEMGSNLAANSGVGTIGVWNYGGEDSTYYNLNIWANLPVVLTQVQSPVGLRGLNPVSSFARTAPSVSMGHQSFEGSTILVALDYVSPALFLDNTNNVTLVNAYMSARNSGPRRGAYSFAVESWNCERFFHHGLIEGFSQYMKSPRNLTFADINITMASRPEPAKPLIDITPEPRGTDGLVLDSSITIDPGPGTGETFYADSTINGFQNSGQPVSSRLLGVSVTGGKATLAKNILFNSSNSSFVSGQLLMTDEQADFEIKNHNISKQIGGSSVLRSEGALDVTSNPVVARIEMPALVAPRLNGGSVHVQLEGMLNAGDAAVEAPAEMFFSAGIGILARADSGSLVITGAKVSSGSQGAIDPLKNNIVLDSVTASVDGNRVISIAIHARNPGSEHVLIRFTGKITCSYQGFYREAPRFQDDSEWAVSKKPR